jgi:hypothetical protein
VPRGHPPQSKRNTTMKMTPKLEAALVALRDADADAEFLAKATARGDHETAVRASMKRDRAIEDLCNIFRIRAEAA